MPLLLQLLHLFVPIFRPLSANSSLHNLRERPVFASCLHQLPGFEWPQLGLGALSTVVVHLLCGVDLHGKILVEVRFDEVSEESEHVARWVRL